MLNTPFSQWPSFAADEANAVRDVILSGKVNYWTGQECRQFEAEFAKWLDVSHAVSLANGTLALDLALRVLGIGDGDEVVVTSRTFLASVSSIVNAGAIPIFADVDANSQNITPDTIERVLTPRTRAIMCVHLAGWPCDMHGIMSLAKHHDLKVIEDCAQAHGAKIDGKSVGSFGDANAWSFCQDKIMTTGGEGGMLTTNDSALWSAAWAYKDHGKSWDAVYSKVHPPGFRWLHESFGTNWRMLEVQGVLGRLQLRKMPAWHSAREANARAILETCESSGLRAPRPAQNLTHAWYRAYAFVQADRLKAGWSRDRIMAEVNAAGVPCYSGSCSEVYLEKAFDGTPFRPSQRLPVAKMLGETSLMFLVHPTLTNDEIEKTCQAIKTVMDSALR